MSAHEEVDTFWSGPQYDSEEEQEGYSGLDGGQEDWQYVSRQHENNLRYQLGEYVQNSLPMRLLRVSDMTLVGRVSLQEEINKDIDHISNCYKDPCNCFEKLKVKLKYSILSHRWGPYELTFSDLQKFDALLAEKGESHLKGSARLEKIQAHYKGQLYEQSATKLLNFLQVSAQKRCEYAWADTMCINKESSAELDESIRSMYTWYQDSHICIVHLSETTYPYQIAKDPWFTRGWTLQELLAPKRIAFFSKYWKKITTTDGDKLQEKKRIESGQDGGSDHSLWPVISNNTGIPIEDLLDFKPGLYDIGKRLNWASKRRTTRIEDMAYCLIGIFCVKLSISYGEKEGAFYRLQDEIMENSKDGSLFNWSGPTSTYNSMFAASPACFARNSAGNLILRNPPPNPNATFTSANYVLRISLVLHDISQYPATNSADVDRATAFAILDPSDSGEHFVVLLEKIGERGEYRRVKVSSVELGADLLAGKREEITIR